MTRGPPAYTADPSAGYGMLYIVRLLTTSTGGDVIAKWVVGPESVSIKKASTDGSQTIPGGATVADTIAGVGNTAVSNVTGAVAGATVSARSSPPSNTMARSNSSSQFRTPAAPTLPPINTFILPHHVQAPPTPPAQTQSSLGAILNGQYRLLSVEEITILLKDPQHGEYFRTMMSVVIAARINELQSASAQLMKFL